MKSILFFVAASLLLSVSSCKGKKDSNALTQVQTVISDTLKVTEVVKETPKPPTVEKSTHFLIAGCFRIKSNADRLFSKLEGQGYSPRILPYYNDLYLVAYSGYPTKAEAQIALNNMVYREGKRCTWIYPVR